MAINNQFHIRIKPEKQRRWIAWCDQHGVTMSEVCHLFISALLDGRLTVDMFDTKETDDDRQT